MASIKRTAWTIGRCIVEYVRNNPVPVSDVKVLDAIRPDFELVSTARPCPMMQAKRFKVERERRVFGALSGSAGGRPPKAQITERRAGIYVAGRLPTRSRWTRTWSGNRQGVRSNAQTAAVTLFVYGGAALRAPGPPQPGDRTRIRMFSGVALCADIHLQVSKPIDPRCSDEYHPAKLSIT